MDLPIIGFGISGHRSYRGEPQLLGPFKKINIFIGENNAGKSNVLRFIRKVYSSISCRQNVRDGNVVDGPYGTAPAESFPVLVRIDATILSRHFSFLRGQALDMAVAAFDHKYKGAPPSHFWFDLNRAGVPGSNDYRAYRKGNDEPIQTAWTNIVRGSGGGPEHWYPSLLDDVAKKLVQPVKPIFVPTSRRIPSNLKAFQDEYSAPASDEPSLIVQLAAYEHPDYSKPEDRAKFETIQGFVRTVLKRPDLRLSIQHDRQTINIEDYGRYPQPIKLWNLPA